MRICDFCHSRGEYRVSTTQIAIGNDFEEVNDACESCAMSVKEMLNQPKADPEERRSPGRPRKKES